MKLEEKKKKPYSSVTYTTGDPKLNIDHFNKMLMGKEENTHTDGYLNGTFKHDNKAAEQAAAKVGTFASQSPDGASSISTGAASSGSGDAGGSAGGVGESLVKDGNELEEAKRYVRRYYMRPQDIFCSNKDEVLKALIEHENENCTIYTLNNLGDNKDIHKLTNDDIIYYYDDGILYDKNHVRIMDYDLSIKHEEEREKINPNTVSDKTFADVYDDRMTELTQLDEELAADFDASQLDQFVGKTCTRKGVTGEFSYEFDDGELMGYITDASDHVAMFDLEKAVSSGALVFNDSADTETIRAIISGGERSYGSGSSDNTTITGPAKTPEEEAAARKKLMAKAEEDGKAFAEQQFNMPNGKNNYKKFKKEEFDGDIYTFTMHQAYVKRYEELRLEAIKNAEANKEENKKQTSSQLIKDYATEPSIKEWFKNNVDKMQMSLYYSESGHPNDAYGQDYFTDDMLAKIEGRTNKFINEHPDAEYILRNIDDQPEGSVEKWARKGWYNRQSAEVKFKKPLSTAPDNVKAFISACKQKSIENNASEDADAGVKIDWNSRSIKNIYLYYALLEMFNNDARFYEHNDISVEEAFNLDFDSVDEVPDFSDLQEALDASFDTHSLDEFIGKHCVITIGSKVLDGTIKSFTKDDENRVIITVESNDKSFEVILETVVDLNNIKLDDETDTADLKNIIIAAKLPEEEVVVVDPKVAAKKEAENGKADGKATAIEQFGTERGKTNFNKYKDEYNTHQLDKRNLYQYYYKLTFLQTYQGLKNEAKAKKAAEKAAKAKHEEFCLDFDSLAEDVSDNKCVICGEEIRGYGNNAEPYTHGRCCDACNLKFVLPARIEALRRGE